MTRNRIDHAFDYALLFKDAGLVAASAAAEVASAAKIVDLGAAVRVDATMIVDVSVLEVDSNDELYDIVVQGSSSSTFGSAIQNLGQLSIGAAGAHTTRGDGAALDTTGHYEIAFTNEQNGTSYRYLRVFTVVAGTIAGGGGINYTAHAALKA
jgi:hypothetical protein